MQNDYNIYDLIKKLPFRYIIAAFDGDEAGERGAYRLIKNLPNKLVKVFIVSSYIFLSSKFKECIFKIGLLCF